MEGIDYRQNELFLEAGDVFEEIGSFVGEMEQFDDITMPGLKVHDKDIYNQ